MTVYVKTDLPADSLIAERYDDCPRCGEPVKQINRARFTPTPEMFDPEYPPYDNVTMLPCRHVFEIDSAELDGWTVHVPEGSLDSHGQPTLTPPISPYQGG